MRKSLRKVDYRHYVCIFLTCGIVLLGGLFPHALSRVIESLRDLVLSIGYYFCEMTDIPHGIIPTVTEKSVLEAKVFLLFSLEEFSEKWHLYWQVIITKNNVIDYLSFLLNLFVNFSKFIVIVFPFVLVLYIVFIRSLKSENNDYNKDSKPLKIFKRFIALVYIPCKKWFLDFWGFIKGYKRYWLTWILVLCFYFNFYAIAVEVIAYYLYFIVLFDLKTLYFQFYKLLIDLSTVITFIPLWGHIFIGLVIFDKIRKKIAYAILNHYEMKNRGFINERPVVSMDCATMGKKKTTMITDMGLSQDVMFRDKAFEKILENDLKFPYFPWINLENEIKRAMQFHEIYNLSTCRKFIDKKEKRWNKNTGINKIFGYDYPRYGLLYDDKLKVSDVWEVIKTYTQLYFIYVIQSSLIISNYSVRTDNLLYDIGNFPLWNTDFFKKDSRLIDSFSRHAHILDFDSLRLGRKVIEENPNKDGFEFGVVLITEVGKERGNSLENIEKKKRITLLIRRTIYLILGLKWFVIVRR